MKLALSSDIKKIDEFSHDALGISVRELMKKSGDAVAGVIRKRVATGKHVVFLAGKGNNGGDAYAAACDLFFDYDVTVYDVFSSGQRTEEGKSFLSRFRELGGKIVNYDFSKETLKSIKESDVIVDAVFGTGFFGEVPEDLRTLSVGIREAFRGLKIAIDVPLGINADDGSVSDFAVSVDVTVALSFIKPGIISYPARSFVGEIVYVELGLPIQKIEENFSFPYFTMTENEALSSIPKRCENSNKSSFGKLLLISGSKRYRGAAHLSAEAALRSGVGYVNYCGEAELADSLSMKYPEIIYKTVSPIETLKEKEENEISKLSASCTATLIGPGSDNTEGLLKLTLKLLDAEGSPLILDADAINALAGIGERGREALKNKRRPVILTPHPLEFARLRDVPVATVQQHRIRYAVDFAKEYGVILVLKGAGSIVTDGENTMVNTLGNSALAKAGSGDVLAGVLSSFAAQSSFTPFWAACIAVVLHSLAGENLARKYSTYGVTPSDLPREIASVIAKAQNQQ